MLLEKSEVQTVLQNFCTMTMKEFNKEVKKVRSDNGTEFMPVRFWGEAILTTSQLINRTPSVVLNNVLPYELLYQAKPSYEHLRVFGSLCFVHSKSRDKDKFGLRSKRCVFVGYPFTQKGWKVFYLET